MRLEPRSQKSRAPSFCYQRDSDNPWLTSTNQLLKDRNGFRGNGNMVRREGMELTSKRILLRNCTWMDNRRGEDYSFSLAAFDLVGIPRDESLPVSLVNRGKLREDRREVFKECACNLRGDISDHRIRCDDRSFATTHSVWQHDSIGKLQSQAVAEIRIIHPLPLGKISLSLSWLCRRWNRIVTFSEVRGMGILIYLWKPQWSKTDRMIDFLGEKFNNQPI
jgi:hypothetical protein